MPVRQMLASMDALELARWEIWINREEWQKHLESKEQRQLSPAEKTALLKNTLFGKQHGKHRQPSS